MIAQTTRPRAGDSHAQKESPTTGQVAGPNNIMTPIVAQDDDRKVFAHLAARAALKGHQLTKTVSGYPPTISARLSRRAPR